jgi:hypothetical protein
VFDETYFPFKFTFSSYSCPLITSISSPSPLIVLQLETTFTPPITPLLLSEPHDSSNSIYPSVTLPITKVYARRHFLKLPLPITPSPAPPSIHSMQTRFKTKVLARSSTSLLSTNYSFDNVDLDPTIYNHAAKYSHWRDAMAKELDALGQNNNWSLILSSKTSNVIGYK